MKIYLFAVLSLLIYSGSPTYAAPVQPGILLGGNYIDATYNGTGMTGYGFSAGAVVSFFSDILFGLRATVVDHFYNLHGGTNTISWGHAPTLTATANYNYNHSGGRTSAGIGYGTQLMTGINCSGSSNCPSFPSATSGLVIEIKEDLPNSSFIGLGQAYIPLSGVGSQFKMYQISIMVGWQLGSKSK